MCEVIGLLLFSATVYESHLYWNVEFGFATIQIGLMANKLVQISIGSVYLFP